MFINKHFILASSSRSRYILLKKLNLNFKKTKPKCDEEKIKKTLKKTKATPITTVRALAREKSFSVSNKINNKIVIGCDTIIVLGKRLVDKAKNKNEAIKKIKSFSGKKHKIITAMCASINGKQIWLHTETTIIKVRKLSNKTIKKYLKKTGDQILNSVGCYQIESMGPIIIENIKGDFFNVMGLPLFDFLNFLKTTETKK